jgi:hypothetical protein
MMPLFARCSRCAAAMPLRCHAMLPLRHYFCHAHLLLLPMPFRHTLPLLRRIFFDATLAADFRRGFAPLRAAADTLPPCRHADTPPLPTLPLRYAIAARYCHAIAADAAMPLRAER